MKNRTPKRREDPIAQSPSQVVFPMRINKFLALKNYATRRGADELVTRKRVLINGRLAVLGDKVEETDEVEVQERGKRRDFAYFAFNKPLGLITHAQSKREQDIVRSLPAPLRGLKLFAVGRLDKNSQGLIILTNDGRITDRLLNPIHEHEKEYEVTVAKPLRANFKEKVEKGIDIEGYTTKPAAVRILGDRKFNIQLTEGKTHQIRRMISALFNEVADLKRIRIMNIKLGNLKAGSYREIKGEELSVFLKNLGLSA